MLAEGCLLACPSLLLVSSVLLLASLASGVGAGTHAMHAAAPAWVPVAPSSEAFLFCCPPILVLHTPLWDAHWCCHSSYQLPALRPLAEAVDMQAMRMSRPHAQCWPHALLFSALLFTRSSHACMEREMCDATAHSSTSWHACMHTSPLPQPPVRPPALVGNDAPVCRGQ